jgi:hypothetical protein
MLRHLVAAIFVLVLGFDKVWALDMNWALDQNEKLAYLNLWGKIEPGDDTKFRSIVTPLLKQGYLIFKINLFTGGGSVAAAKGMADQIKILQARTVAPTRFSDIINGQRVQRSYPSCWFDKQAGDGVVPNPVDSAPWCTCASACFLVWASGIVREGNHVGIHRIAYLGEGGRRFGQLSGPQAREQYQRDQRDVQVYLDSLDVPRTISDRMWATESANMYYLTKPELDLMTSTPYLEEQTMARCGPDRTEHMSAGNNWTATFDAQHVNCYRGLLKEFMREGAAKYLANAGEAMPTPGVGGPFIPAPVVPVERPQIVTRMSLPKDAGSRWSHNGSAMYLVASAGTVRKFFYETPRPGMLEVGVKFGTLLFEGKRVGDEYVGTAYRFWPNCRPEGYRVQGPISDDEKRVTMRGRAPQKNANCDVIGYDEDKLIFEYKEMVVREGE